MKVLSLILALLSLSSGVLLAQDTQGFVMPIGSILAFGGSTAPEGWLLCDGAEVNRDKYAELFKVLGTAYGKGDGSTTFNLPNLQGVSPTGVGGQTIAGHAKIGPVLGEVREDTYQRHGHKLSMYGYDTSVVHSPSPKMRSPNLASQGDVYVQFPKTLDLKVLLPFRPDVAGDPVAMGIETQPPRVGDYTHGPEIGVNFIIKY